MFSVLGKRGASDQFLARATDRSSGSIIRVRKQLLKEGRIVMTDMQERSYTSKRWVAVYAINDEV